MVKLNLETKNNGEVILKDYLENNASEILAGKINNGVRIEKDGKTVINKKTIVTFMRYAAHRAYKESGEQWNGFGEDIIFSWAIHYFEEDSIEGQLYNEDGTEYKPVVVQAPRPVAKNKTTTSTLPKIEKTTLFDLMTAQETQTKLNDADFQLEKNPEENNEPTNQEYTEPVDDPEDESVFTPTEQEQIMEQLANQVPETKKHLAEVIKEKYLHPENNIIVCGMPKIIEPAKIEIKAESATEIKAESTPTQSGTTYIDKSTGEIKELPSILIKLFGDALKVEVF